MFGMNGFHVSASGAIQGHHGPLVFLRIAGRGDNLKSENVYAPHHIKRLGAYWFTIVCLSICLSAQT